MKINLQRRTDLEKHQVGDYFDGPDRYYDNINEKTVIKLYSGGWYTSQMPGEMIVTILGSCVACCLYDPKLKIGGMNHFLLPGDIHNIASSARFGVNAMELLINSLIKKGSLKKTLIGKIFGGASILIDSTARVGERNIAFIEKFLEEEGMQLYSKDVGGSLPRKVHFFPDTGKVMVRKLQRREDLRIAQFEKEYLEKAITQKPKVEEDITLF